MSDITKKITPPIPDPPKDGIRFVGDVPTELEKVIGIKISHALWLADEASIGGLYVKYMANGRDYDAYEIGSVILSELGYDGTLYGYPSLPKPLPITMEELTIAVDE